MKKRLLACLLTAAMLVSLFPLPALAAEAEPYTGGLCPHHTEHSYEVCGYIEAVEGQPCGYVCRICPVQAMIDALLDTENITGDNAGKVTAQVEDIGTAMEALTGEEAGQLDLTRYLAAVNALMALGGENGDDENGGNDLPAPLDALASVDYWDASGNKQSASSVTVVDSSTTEWTDGWYVVNSGDAENPLKIDSRITVSGAVNLILADGYALNATKGITVEDANSLTIYGQQSGTGQLTATGGTAQAGIGGNSDGVGGTITINGGTVDATGGYDYPYMGGSGIGGGAYAAGGIIIINGGTVTASGRRGGAGIGGGGAGAGGNVTITGGTVTTNGRIGCGDQSSNSGTFGTGMNGNAVIIASDGISDKTGQGNWSGIIFEGDTGAVYGNQTLRLDLEIKSYQTLTVANNSTLTVPNDKALINSGIITNYGAISGALTNSGTISNNGTISGTLTNNGTILVGTNGSIPTGTSDGTIKRVTDQDMTYLDSDGQLKAISNLSPVTFLVPGMTMWNSGCYVAYGDITLDQRAVVSGTVQLVLLDGCSLNAKSGIDVGETNSLTIYGQPSGTGQLTAKGGFAQAGIGGANDKNSGVITINGGTITATGGAGKGNNYLYAAAGIGGGNSGAGGTITINGGTITATGGAAPGVDNVAAAAGIGGGDSGAGGSVTITGGTVIATGGWNAAGIGGGADSSDNGTFSTDSNGNAFIIASSISDNSPSKKNSWSGVIFEGSEGQVYGTPTLKTDATIPSDKNLEIPADKALTIDNGVTLTNEGEITNNGTLTIDSTGKLVNNGTITNNSTNQGITGNGAIEGSGTLTGSGTLADTVKYQRQSSVTISFEGTDVTGGNSVPYGSTITIKATAAKAATNGLNRATANQMVFFVGTGSSKQSLGTATVDGNSTASLQITLSGTDWGKGFQIDANTITAEYSGSEYLKDATQTATLTVTKKELTASISGTATKTYDGNTTATGLSIDLTGKVLGDDVSATATSYTYDDANVGTGKTITASGITLTGADAGNYTLKSDTATTTGSITKATPTPDTPNNLTAIYGQTLADVSLPTGWAWDVLSTPVGNIGDHSFPAIYTQDNSGNYNTVQKTLTVTVSAAPRTITVTGQADSPTQITLSDATITPSGTGGKVSYGKNTINTAPSTWQAEKEFSGLTADITYYFFAKVEADGNYAAAVSEGVAISTPAKAVSNIAIASQPTTLRYTSGQTLDLSGLSVTVNYNDGTNGTIEWVSGKLTADPDAGTVLTVTKHNGKTVTISYGGATAETSVLTVTQGTQATASITGAPATIYNGDSFTLTLSGGSGTGAVTWEIVSGPATVDATTGKVTVTGTGEIQIKAVKAADTDYTQTEATITLNAVARPSPPTGGGSGGTYTPTYPPTVEKPSGGGGTPTVTPSNPKQGDTVTVTPKPDNGYEVDTITVIDRNGKPVEVTQKPDGTYTFKQPSGKVTIKVTYQPIDRPWNNPFTDVSEGDWYYEAVRFVQERGLMNGYSDGRFGPNDNLSRAQLAQILFNKEGRPGVNYLLDFSDVAGEAWYTEAIRWATSQGIVSGYGNGTFGPNDPITREQLAVMLWRYVGSPAATNKELHFNDTDEISPFALEALRWAVENGILNGYGDGRLGPQGQATRAQVAQMLKNFIENQEEENT